MPPQAWETRLLATLEREVPQGRVLHTPQHGNPEEGQSPVRTARPEAASPARALLPQPRSCPEPPLLGLGTEQPRVEPGCQAQEPGREPPPPARQRRPPCRSPCTGSAARDWLARLSISPRGRGQRARPSEGFVIAERRRGRCGGGGPVSWRRQRRPARSSPAATLRRWAPTLRPRRWREAPCAPWTGWRGRWVRGGRKGRPGAGLARPGRRRLRTAPGSPLPGGPSRACSCFSPACGALLGSRGGVQRRREKQPATNWGAASLLEVVPAWPLSGLGAGGAGCGPPGGAAPGCVACCCVSRSWPCLCLLVTGRLLSLRSVTNDVSHEKLQSA